MDEVNDNFRLDEASEARLKNSMGALEYNKKYFRWSYFKPNSRQAEWCNLGGDDDPQARAFQLTANTQGGKSTIGAYALACHLLGRYPPWWKGRKFLPSNRPNLERPHSFSCWLIGADATSVRSVMVAKLLGGLDEYTRGTGMIPRDRILRVTKASRPSDSLDECIVLRDDGTTAVISCRFYTQERAQMQGATLDVAWMDEDPGDAGMTIFGEIMMRLARTGPGLLLSTQTPLYGRSFMVKTFSENAGDIYRTVRMQLSDCTHMQPHEIEAIRKDIATRPWEQEAREFGRPSMGMGNVFQTPVDDITHRLDISSIPPHWPMLWGADFDHGGQSAQSHPAGFALAAIDRQNDVIYIIEAFRLRGGMLACVDRIKSVLGGRAWQGIPFTYGADGSHGVAGSTETYAGQYRSKGLKMLHKHATFDLKMGGGIDYDAAIAEMRNRFATGRLKIAAHLAEALEEYRHLIYKDNKVVKVENDILDAIRFIVMAHREAKIFVPGGQGAYTGNSRPVQTRAIGTSDFYFGID